MVIYTFQNFSVDLKKKIQNFRKLSPKSRKITPTCQIFPVTYTEVSVLLKNGVFTNLANQFSHSGNFIIQNVFINLFGNSFAIIG